MSSEKQLLKDLDEIAEVTANIENDWEQRIGALRKLQGLVAGGAANYPTFMVVLNTKLRENIAKQVTNQDFFPKIL